MKPLMINAADRNVINHDNCIFYFNKLLKLNNIKIQNDVLTKEKIMGKGIKSLSTIGGIISSVLFIFSYIYPLYNIKKCWECSNGSKHNVE